MSRRLSAITALLLATATIVLVAVDAIESFPHGLPVLACLLLAIAAAWWGLVRRGPARVLGGVLGAGFLIAALVFVVVGGRLLWSLLIVVCFALSLELMRRVFAVRATLPRAQRPQHPILIYNPKSGGGKAERFKLADEARARGIEPIELRPGTDLVKLVRDAVAKGADALGMAGGDGSQAVVARVAAECGLPYVCVPAGTRNHFALDLGVDRDDVVGALDAFVDGGERIVDLAEVNSRVFVNNVSLGLYAEAVQNASYRDAKMRTLADTVPAVLGPQGRGLGLSWLGPDGQRHENGAAILVSNDPYRLGRALGSGTRPRLDAGTLGITVIGAGRGESTGGGPVAQWSADTFEVQSDRDVAAGIDGEALLLSPPLRFTTHPKALRVRIAPQHPGASPSARMPAGPWKGIRAVLHVAVTGDL